MCWSAGTVVFAHRLFSDPLQGLGKAGGCRSNGLGFASPPSSDFEQIIQRIELRTVSLTR